MVFVFQGTDTVTGFGSVHPEDGLTMRRRGDAGHVNGGGVRLILNSFNYLQV